MKFDSISQVLEIVGLAQGLIIGFYFVFKKENKSINLLGLFLLSYCAPFISYFFMETGMLKTYPSLFFLPLGFYFMAVPLFFLYVENLIYKITRISFLKHLAVGALEFMVLSVLYSMPTREAVELFYRYEWLYNFIYSDLLGVFSLSYLVFILNRLHIYKKRSLQIYADDSINVSWLQKTTILLIIMYSFQYIASKIIIQDVFKEPLYIIDSILATLFIYWISIFGLKLTGMPKLDANMTKGSHQKNEDLEESEYLKIKELVIAEKLYRNTSLNIYILSEASEMPTRKISQLINYFYGDNFNSFINSFRIDEAKVLIRSNNFEHYTIEAIAKEAGFNSKSSFNTYFKAQEGMTPTAYKSVHKTVNRKNSNLT